MSGRVGRTTIVYFLSQALSSVAGFFATWFIANQLGSTILGEYSVIVALLFWLNIPASAIGAAVNKRISENEETGSYLAGAHLINGIVSLLLVIGVLIGSEQINALANGRNISLFVCGLVVAQGLFDITIESLRGNKKVGISGFLKTFERISRSSIQISIIIIGFGFIWLVIGHSISLLLTTIIGAIILNKWPKIPSKVHFEDIIRFAKYSWLGTMKSRAFGWMDTIILAAFATQGFGAVVTHSQIGIYEATWSLASTLGIISVSINQTLFPEVSNLSSIQNYKRVRNLLTDGLAFTGMFAIPGIVGGAILGGDLLALYRPEFAQGKWILVILIGARVVSSYNTQMINVINAIDRPDIAFRINIIFLTSNFLLNFGLIYLYGWYGAALATMLTGMVSMIISTAVLTRILGNLSYPYREIINQIVAALFMGVIIFVTKSQFQTSGYTVLLLVLGGATVYALTLFSISDTFRMKVISNL